MTIEVNYWAVIAAAIVNMLVGSLWYSDALFGRRWMALMGKKETDLANMKKEAPKGYFGMFIGSLILSFVLAVFLGYRGVTGALDGVLVGALAWLGFVFTTMMGTALFESRPRGLFYLNSGFHLVSMVIMGLVLAWWR